MTDTQANNRRIARNTLMLYLRMAFSMIVQLYTSRVVLSTLGVEDFGIFGVVGGIVALFDFINASMSGCTSRFLTFELGKKDFNKLRNTFSTAMFVHMSIALIVLIVSETIGLWFMHNKMLIPESRMDAAQIVFHLSVLSMIISVTQVPYNASIISHEKMDIYAYIEIVNVVLKLAIVYMLQICKSDKLITYAILTLVVSISIAMFYRIYCMKHFNECHIRRIWCPNIFRKMLTFSGWDFYGNLSVTMRTQGVSMLLNVFFGPLMNAAAMIAAQVQGAIMAFAQNVTTAVRPQIIKRYAAGEIYSMVELIRNSIKLNFLILLFISAPLISELHFILFIWLGQVPNYTVIFCELTLLFNFFANLSSLLVIGIHATGKIFRPSFINGTLYLLVIPISYISFKFGGYSWTAYFFNVIAVILGMLSNAYTLNLYIKQFPLAKFILRDLLPCILLMIIVLSILHSIKYAIDEGWIRFIIAGMVSSLLTSILGYKFILPPSIKERLIVNIKNRLWERT